jgi:hypothetical protein
LLVTNKQTSLDTDPKEMHLFLRQIASAVEDEGIAGVGTVRPLIPVTRRPDDDSRQKRRESPPGAGKSKQAPPALPHHIDEYA